MPSGHKTPFNKFQIPMTSRWWPKWTLLWTCTQSGAKLPMAADLPFLETTIKEVMRLYPPANVLYRGLDQDLELRSQDGDIGFNGTYHVLPKSSRVFIDIIGLHTDPRYWKHPLVFDPTRFIQLRNWMRVNTFPLAAALAWPAPGSAGHHSAEIHARAHWGAGRCQAIRSEPNPRAA